MNPSNSATVLERLRTEYGAVFGSENICQFLAYHIRATEAMNVLELGTGLGVSAIFMAHALKQISNGKVYTIDNRLTTSMKDSFPELFSESLSLKDHVEKFSRELELGENLELVDGEIDLNNHFETHSRFKSIIKNNKFDIVFSDFSHAPEECLSVLFTTLPLMNDDSSILIDSAPTYAPSLLALEKTIGHLNQGKIPAFVQSIANVELKRDIMGFVLSHTFQLIPLVERRKTAQNSTAWIRISSPDYIPSHASSMRY